MHNKGMSSVVVSVRLTPSSCTRRSGVWRTPSMLTSTVSNDVDGFKSQLERLQPLARHIRQVEKLDNLQCWRVCLSRSGGRNRANYPTRELLPPLVAYAAWTMSTSGV